MGPMFHFYKLWSILSTVSEGSSIRNKDGSGTFTVYVEGSAGSGKSTFIEMFSNRQDIAVYQEPVQSWQNVNGTNLFEKMFKDPKRWAGVFQLHSTLSRMRSVSDILERSKRIRVFERSVYSERYCFLEFMMAHMYISKPEGALMGKWFEFLINNFEKRIKPDLIIYLRGDIEIFKERIAKRGRKEEEHVPDGFFEEINKRHDEWLYHQNSSFSIPAEVIIVDANQELNGFRQEILDIEQKFFPL